MNMPTDDERKQLEEEMRKPLSEWNVRPVDFSDTARLIRALQPEFNRLQTQAEWTNAQIADSARRPSLFRLMLAQLSSYPKSYWLASIAVFAMLALMLSNQQPPYTGLSDAYALFTPAVMLAGLLYSFRTWNKGMRAIESVTPYPPALLLLCRFLIVIGLNVALSLLTTVYLAASMDRFPLLPFLLQWFSQMLLTGGLLAYLMLRKGIKTGIAAALLVWIAWNGYDIGTSALPDAASLTLAGYTLAMLIGGTLLGLAYRRSLGIRFMK